LTGKKIGMEPTMELYFNRKEGAGEPPKYKQKQKIREKGAKRSVQVASKRSRPQRHRASKNIEL